MRSYRAYALDLDPLGPMEPSTRADSPSGPLALDPLSPVDCDEGPTDADDSEHTSD
jgi:hypothetical protein